MFLFKIIQQSANLKSRIDAYLYIWIHHCTSIWMANDLRPSSVIIHTMYIRVPSRRLCQLSLTLSILLSNLLSHRHSSRLSLPLPLFLTITCSTFSLSLSLSVFLSPTISIHFVFSHNDTYHSHDNLITLTHNYMSYSRISMNSMSINLLCQLIWRYM